MPATQEALRINPTDAEVQHFADRIMPDFSRIASKAKNFAPTVEPIRGVTPNGEEYSLEIYETQGHLISRVRKVDKRVRLARVKTFEGELTSMHPIDMSFRTIWNTARGKDVEVEARFGKPFFLRYEVGELSDDDVMVAPVFTTEVLVDANKEKTGVELQEVCQRVFLTNPNQNGEGLVLDVVGRVTDGGFGFAMEIRGLYKHKKENVLSVCKKIFEPQDVHGRVLYIGSSPTLKVIQGFPKPLNVAMSEDELERVKIGRAGAARIARYMPRQFTPDQVEMMVGNAFEGRVMTAGVWNPLVVPYTRKASRRN